MNTSSFSSWQEHGGDTVTTLEYTRCPSGNLCNTNPTQTGVVLKLGLRNERSPANSLRKGTEETNFKG
jgi:hypothetical protein